MFHGDISPHIAQGLKELRKRIDSAKIPPSILDESINIATWNIALFGAAERREEAIYFIAEVLNQFDLIAIVELRYDLTDLGRVLRILGPYWRAVYSDVTADHGGNWERIAFIYDKRAVTFTGLAAEADAPRKKDPDTGEYVAEFSWWRSPYMASFSSGNFDFEIIAAHIRWGDKEEERIGPLRLLAEWIHKRTSRRDVAEKDVILVGDFNIPSTSDGDLLFRAITSKGLRIPPGLAQRDLGSNLSRNKRYDQILHYPRRTKSFTGNGGVLDIYAGNPKPLFGDKDEFETQLSDHLPLWAQLDVWAEDERLDRILQ